MVIIFVFVSVLVTKIALLADLTQRFYNDGRIRQRSTHIVKFDFVHYVCIVNRPTICIWKTDGWQKNSADIRISRIIAYTKKIRLGFGWSQTISAELLNLNVLKWLPTWVRYLMLSSVSLMLQNLQLHPSEVSTHKKDSLQITRSHLLECWFHFIIRISVFFRRTKIRRRLVSTRVDSRGN